MTSKCDKTQRLHLSRGRVYNWCSYHIFTSSFIWTDERKREIYLFYIVMRQKMPMMTSSMRLYSNRSEVRTNQNACRIHINFTGKRFGGWPFACEIIPRLDAFLAPPSLANLNPFYPVLLKLYGLKTYSWCCLLFHFQVFPANSDKNSIVKHSLSTDVKARYVRFYPVTHKSHPCLRVEIFVLK